jgi:hypothetical protein
MAFENLKGVTLKAIEGLEDGSDRVRFVADDGRAWLMWYEHDCCGSAVVHDLAGDVSDLLGSPILLAEESSNQDNPPENADSFTWTFYKLATVKGYVTITWLISLSSSKLTLSELTLSLYRLNR